MANSPPGSAPPAADPVTDAEFAAVMARLGPWDAARQVAVAVSGGADSLCLALLTHSWGAATAIIVDHGLRAESAREAAWTAGTLRARGMSARIVTLTELRPGPGLAARARDSRYQALFSACWDAGLVDLLAGHHAGDQSETVLMRQRHGSGLAGMAGMAAIASMGAVRLIRPLLATAPDRLRATLRHRGQTWVEDPSNADLRSTRVRLRAELDGAVLSARPEGLARAKAEMAAAAELAVRAAVYPEGFAVLSPGRIGAGALAMLLRSIGAQRYGAAPRSAATLAACLRPATLAGVRVLPAGRLGPGWLLVREEAAMQPPVVLADGAVWDGRFRATGRPDGAFTLGALGADAVRFRHTSPWPAAVLAGLPAIRRNNMLSAVPHLAYVQFDSGLEQVSVHHAGAPVCGAPFMAI